MLGIQPRPILTAAGRAIRSVEVVGSEFRWQVLRLCHLEAGLITTKPPEWLI